MLSGISEDCMREVRVMAARYRRTAGNRLDYGDLVNAGIVGLLRASRRHCDGGGASMKNFAAKAIRGEILDAIAAACPVRVRTPRGDERLYESIGLDSSIARLGDSGGEIIDCDDDGESTVLTDGLSAAMDGLTPGQRSVVEALYLESPPRSATEFARDAGVPVGTVRSQHFHALRKLRCLLTDQFADQGCPDVVEA